MNILFVGTPFPELHTYTEAAGMQMQMAANAMEALYMLKEGNTVDAILCEYNLSGQNGLALFEYLQSNPPLNDIPFILLTPEFNPGLYKTAFQKGVHDYYVIHSANFKRITDRLKDLHALAKMKAPAEVSAQNPAVFKIPLSKRIFDIVVAGTVLLLAFPLLLLVALAIRLESKGPIIYKSKRVGRRIFDFYKFRSMRSDADALLKKLAKEKNQYKTGAQQLEIDYSKPCPNCAALPEGSSCSPLLYIDKHQICEYWYNYQMKYMVEKASFVKIADDPRITRVGKFIRNTSIDELPQLINVLKGDMSIVGNRPLPIYEAEQLTVDDLSKRFIAPAGITGLWQVELRGRGGVMSEEERKALDNQYADLFRNGTYTLWYDLKLILRTIPALFQKSNV